MKKFTYTGKQVMSFTLVDKDAESKRIETDFILNERDQVDLPSENEHVKGLIFKGWLIEAAEEATVETAKTKK